MKHLPAETPDRNVVAYALSFPRGVRYSVH